MTEYHFFELLKGFRNREKLSQARLADRIGVSRPTLSDWENKRIPTRDMILLLAESLTLSGDETNQLLASAGYLPNELQEKKQEEDKQDREAPQIVPPDYVAPAPHHHHEEPDIFKLKDEQIRYDTKIDEPIKVSDKSNRSRRPYIYVGIAAVLGAVGLMFTLFSNSHNHDETESPVEILGNEEAVLSNNHNHDETEPPVLFVESEDTVRFAIIGRYGSGSESAQSVAELIADKEVDFVATVGNNVFAAAEDESTWHALDNKVGQFYHQYMYPYEGEYGEGAADGQNHFFPLLGNTDYGHGDDMDKPLLDCVDGETFEQDLRSCSDTEGAWYDYFSLPGNERTYSVKRGAVEVILFSDNYRDPDWDYSAEQNQVLQTAKNKIQESTVSWQLLLLHHPPYTSHRKGGFENRQYDFEAWGADAVVAGNNPFYERLEVDGLPYFVNGAGGHAVEWSGTLSPHSKELVADDYGMMIVDAHESQIRFQYFTQDGALRDELVLQKSNGE